ncbi:MAG: UDP-glucose 4-epimerase GalE [Alphaproteobacteria bacterium]
MANKPAVIVTGGAGYIGSHAVFAFREAAYPVVVVDDLSTGRRDSVPDDVPFIEGDVGDGELVGRVIREHGIGAVAHFAGSIVIPESVADPLKYYRNNTAASRNLIEACVANHVKYFIFSSTAAVYGHPETVPVSEDAPTAPINPYGTSKLMTEWMLRDTAEAHDFTYVALRYFNVAGADPAGRTGQSTPNATHLIKIASQAAVGLRQGIQLFGEDYDTPDGTCIRDYIHVSDLAAAHVDALGHLTAANTNLVLNCGYGHGYSVREVLAAVEKEAGIQLDIRGAPRRPGDAVTLVADVSRLRNDFAWQPRYDDLGTIVRTAVDWERKLAGEGRAKPSND